MFALAIASAALPTLSDLRNAGKEDEVKRVFRYGLRMSLFVAIPASVAIAVLARPLVTVIFGRGVFDPVAVDETTRSLLYQATGVWAVASVRTVVPMFYAHNDTRTPVVASAINLVVFIALAAALMGPLRHVGIAIAVSLAAAAQLGTLLLLLRRSTGRLGLSEVAASAGKSLAASVGMAAVAVGVAHAGAWERGGNSPRNIAVLGLAICAGAVAYFALARLLRSPELDDLLQAVRRRRGGASTKPR
jgi:putative peptidoglycan lipid II flippase